MIQRFAIFILLCCSLSAQEQIVGKVVKVSDGDTITVLDASNTQHKVRMEGIDAPERGQPYGAKSTEALKMALGVGRVTVQVSGKDRYGRTIGRVMLGTVDLNAWMVANGWAWHYKAYSKDSALAALEENARSARAGLWADSMAPQPPWEYRKLARQNDPASNATSSTQAPVTPASRVDSSLEGKWWLNTNSNVRHNASCRHFGTTSRGRPCGRDEGKACGMCGG